MKKTIQAEDIKAGAGAGRVIFVRAPRVLSEDELRTALGGMSRDDMRWLAFHQLLDRKLAAAAFDASSPTLDPTKGTYAGGAMAALAELKDELMKYEQSTLGKGGRADAK